MIHLHFSPKMLAVLLLLSLLSSSAAMSQTRSVPYVAPLRWSPDASKVAVPIENAVAIWDAATEQVLYTLTGHTASVSAVAWSSDSRMIATASTDQTVRVWTTSDGSLLRTLSGHEAPVTAVTWSPDTTRIFSWGFDTRPNLFVWDAATGTLLERHNSGDIVAAYFSPNGQRLTLHTFLSLSIRDGITLEPIAQSPRVMCCTNPIYALAWSPNGNTLVTGSTNGLVTLWDANTGQMLNQLVANPYHESDSRDVDNLALSWVRDVAFAPDGSTVLSVSGDGTVREWQTATGTLIQETHIAPLFTAVWSPYSGRLAVWEPTAQKAADLSNGQVFDPSTGEFTIVVPAPSPERLQAIAAACHAPSSVEQALSENIQADRLTEFVAQVEALPENAIPSACAADLIAVAKALQNP